MYERARSTHNINLLLTRRRRDPDVLPKTKEKKRGLFVPAEKTLAGLVDNKQALKPFGMVLDYC